MTTSLAASKGINKTKDNNTPHGRYSVVKKYGEQQYKKQSASARRRKKIKNKKKQIKSKKKQITHVKYQRKEPITEPVPDNSYHKKNIQKHVQNKPAPKVTLKYTPLQSTITAPEKHPQKTKPTPKSAISKLNAHAQSYTPDKKISSSNTTAIGSVIRKKKYSTFDTDSIKLVFDVMLQSMPIILKRNLFIVSKQSMNLHENNIQCFINMNAPESMFVNYCCTKM